MRKKSRQLTPEEVEWLVQNYANTKNDEIMSRLGQSHSALHRLARELGLKKTAEFMKKCQLATTKAAWIANRRNGWPPKGYVIPNCHRFEKGVSPEQMLGPERNAQRIAKAGESLRDTIRRERLRIRWGLGQKTKRKLVSNPKRTQCRYHLKKHGYIVERGGRQAIVTPQTQRSPKMEAWAKRVDIRIIIHE